MENKIMEFLTSPSLPDLIAYLLIVAVYITIFFVKKFVKKENLFTSANISKKVDDLNSLKKQLEKTQETLEKEREERKTELDAWKKEKEELIRMQQEQAKSIALIAGNVPSLVKNGVASKVAQDLQVAENEELKSVKIKEDK